MNNNRWFNQAGESFQGIPCDNIYGGCPTTAGGTPIIDSTGTSPGGGFPTPLNSQQEMDLANANQQLMQTQLNAMGPYWTQTYKVLQDFTVDVGYCRKHGPIGSTPPAVYGKQTQSGIGNDSRQAGPCVLREEKLIEFKAGEIIRTQGSSGVDKNNPHEIFVPYHPWGGVVQIGDTGGSGIMTIIMSEYPNKLELVSLTYLSKAEVDQITNKKQITTTNTIDTATGNPPEYPLTGAVLPKGTTITFEDMSQCPSGGIIGSDHPCKKVRTGISTGERDKTAREPRWQFKMENGEFLWLSPREYEVIGNITTASTKTAGFGDNKMLIWLVVGGVALWYMNKTGMLKKLAK